VYTFLSVCLYYVQYVGLTGELWKNGRLDLDAVWASESGGSKYLQQGGVADSPTLMGNFEGGYGAAHCSQW